MAGGLIQLVSIGLEDLYLSSEPEITFFKKVYNFIFISWKYPITCSLDITLDMINAL